MKLSRKKLIKNQNGLTLIELLVYLALFALIVLILTNFLFYLIRIQAKNRLSQETWQSAQRAMEIILLEIRNARAVYEPKSYFNSHPGKLSLETTRYLPPDEQISYVDFYLNEQNQLVIKKEGLGPEALTPERIKVKELVFKQMEATSTAIQVRLTAVYDQNSPDPAYRATTSLISSAVLRYGQ